MDKKCDVCGAPVVHHESKEGTQSYEFVLPPAIEQALEALEDSMRSMAELLVSLHDGTEVADKSRVDIVIRAASADSEVGKAREALAAVAPYRKGEK